MTTPPPELSGRYRIRLEGHLEKRWVPLLGDMSLTLEPGGTTLLEGPVPDQAALHGLLQTIRNLGLPLLSVTPDVPPHQEN